MFGYVNVYKPELKMKDFYKYKAYYCGLCKTLKDHYGRFGQMTLSYDMTFLILLLTSLYESDTVKLQNRCLVHPVKKHDSLVNEITVYVAAMNIALTYHHLRDDWMDEKNPAGLAGAGMLKRYYKRINRQYPRQCKAIEESLAALAQCEMRRETNIDLVARCFGELMSELFVYRQDRWEEGLRKIGFYLGKYIYILDAYDDMEKDRKHNSYNPLIQKGENNERDALQTSSMLNNEKDALQTSSMFNNERDALQTSSMLNNEKDTLRTTLISNENLDEDCRHILTMMMAECTKEFEKLPCLLDIDILRNILYDGVWTKFDEIQKERNKRKEQDHDIESL